MKKDILCLITCLLAWTAVSAQLERVKLQLKWRHQFQFAGYYAAQIKGFYKNAGLEVEIVPGDPEHAPIQQVLDGKADFGVTGEDLMLQYQHGKKLTALAAIFQHSANVIISAADKNIRQPRDLIGKTIMVSHQGWMQMKAVLVREKIDTSQIRTIAHTWNNQDILNGHADAMDGYSSVEVNQLEKEGVKLNIIKPSDYGIDFYGDVLFTTEVTSTKKSALTEKFTDASLEGWRYAMANPHEIGKYILTLRGVQDRGITMSSLLMEASKMEPLVVADLVEIGHMNISRWDHMLDVYLSLGLINEKRDMGGFIYDRYEHSMNKFKRTVLYSMLVIIGIVMILIAYSFGLKKAVRKRTKELEEEIVKRKKKQADLEALSIKLETSNHELQQFAYLSSHNLRAPVTNLMSLVKLFERKGLSDKNLSYLEKMERSTTILHQVMADLNDIVSAKRTGAKDFRQLRFEDELEVVKHLISESIESSGANITTDFSESPELWFSSRILQETMLNLLTNSIKYKIPDRPLKIALHSYQDQKYIYLSVRDNGQGIDLAQYGSKLFNIYQRFHPEIEGKGLGLYLVKTQLEQHGASITVESAPGKGTEFTIRFDKQLT